MSSQRQVLVDRERQKAAARLNRVNRAAQLLADEERTPPRSLFDLPVKRKTDDDVSARAKSLLGCYDTVKGSIQTQARDLIGVRSGPQTPGVKPQASLFSPPSKNSQKSSTSHHRQRSSASSEKRRSRSRSNDDTRNAGHNHSSSHSNSHSNSQTSAHDNSQTSAHSNPKHESGSKRDTKEHSKHGQHSNAQTVAKETGRLGNKANLPNLKIKNETKPPWQSDSAHPPLENILQEMKSIDQPLTAIHTPRKDDNRFPFHREDVSKTHKPQTSDRQHSERPNIFANIGTKPASKLKRLEDSDSDSDSGDEAETKSPAPSSGDKTNMAASSRVEAATSHDEQDTTTMLSCASSSDSSSSSSSDSDSDSSSDDDEEPRHDKSPSDATSAAVGGGQTREDDPNKMSWSIDSLIENMKKTSPGSILDNSVSDNPASNNPANDNPTSNNPANDNPASNSSRRGDDFHDFDINDSWKTMDVATTPGALVDQLSPVPDLPPLISPLIKGQNVSHNVDPLLSSSDMDISDSDTAPSVVAKVASKATKTRRRSTTSLGSRSSRHSRSDSNSKTTHSNQTNGPNTTPKKKKVPTATLR